VVYDVHNFTDNTPGTLALTSTTTSAISVPPPSMLKGKSIEEIINRWSTELETHVRDFNKFVTEVAVWDRSLIENGNNVGLPYKMHGCQFDVILSCSSRRCIVMFWLPNENKMISTNRWITSNNRKRSSLLQSKCTRSKCQIFSVARVGPCGRSIPALPTLSVTKSK
jgi:hypothetical protein